MSGSGNERTLLTFSSYASTRPTDWSRAGRFIAYNRGDPKTGGDIWMLPLTGEPQPWPLVRTPFIEVDGRFSPDGRWMAYATNESGRSEIHVRSFPGPEGTWRVSTRGGFRPCWRADGRELFFAGPDGKLMTVEVKPGDGSARPGWDGSRLTFSPHGTASKAWIRSSVRTRYRFVYYHFL